jgi:hypothetical protein
VFIVEEAKDSMSFSAGKKTAKAPSSTGGHGLYLPSGADTSRPSPQRGESMAYPRHHSSGVLSKLSWIVRTNSRAVLATMAFVVFVLVVSSDFIHDSHLVHPGTVGVGLRGSTFAGARRRGYFSNEGSILSKNQFRFAAVTDLDQLSLIKDAKKLSFRSILVPGIITRNEDTNKYTLKVEPARELITKHNEAGRGAEFSELQIFDKRLLTFDDRTGDVFEILNKESGKESYVVPRFVITEGEGDTDKGMKWEWATVKDGELWMGSMGK